ncbi:hypothetical protein BH23BAC2_BH23BAC2_24180 [soil metagenome]
MRAIIKSASYIFHPVWMPFTGSLIYFLITPRFFPFPLIKAKLLAIAITTLFIPIVFYFLLKNLGKAQNMFLSDVKERRWPLFFFCLLISLNLYQILDPFNYPALYYFFVGILFAGMTSFLLSLVKVKISLHMVGLAGVLMFIIALSVHYRINLIYTISFLIAALGLTATSRLQLRAHTWTELGLGFLTGFLPQLIVLNFWL